MVEINRTHRSKKSILVILTILLLTSSSKTTFCKFLLSDYFNFNTINYIPHPYNLKDGSQIYPTLCKDNSSPEICEEVGNLFLIKNDKCTTLATARKGKNYNWERKRIRGTDIYDNEEVFIPVESYEEKEFEEEFRQESLQMMGNDQMVFNSTIFYRKEIKNEILNSQGIDEISYALVCPQQYKHRQSRYKMKVVNKTLYFIYKGNKSCGFDLIEASVFLKRHKAIALIVFVISLFIMVFGRKRKKLSLGLAGVEIGIFTAVAFMADFEHHTHLEDYKLDTFYLCCISIGIVTGIFCAFSTESAIFLQAFNAATVSTFIVTSIYCLTTDTGVTQSVFWGVNIFFSVVLVTITASPKFIYKYAYTFYINYNQPFFFTYCIAVYFDLYPEMITMKVASEYNIRFHVNKYIWFIIVAQVLGIIVMVMQGFDLLTKGKNDEDTFVEERDLLSSLCKRNQSNRIVEEENENWVNS